MKNSKKKDSKNKDSKNEDSKNTNDTIDWDKIKNDIGTSDFSKNLSKSVNNPNNEKDSWGTFGKDMKSASSYILNFKKHLMFMSIMCLIIFLFSLSSGGYYYIFKSIKDMISSRLPANTKPSIIYFIIKILIFYSLFKIILTTLLDLIFVDVNDKHGCEMKDLINFIVDKLGMLYFGLYMLFLFPVYLFSNIKSIYNYIINSLIKVIEIVDSDHKFYNKTSIHSLESSKRDLTNLTNLLNEEVCNFYKILAPLGTGSISRLFRYFLENIFIDEENKSSNKKNKSSNKKNNSESLISSTEQEHSTTMVSLCECLDKKRKRKIKSLSKKSKCDIKSDEFETDSNIIACSYSSSITIYFIILGIFYLLLFSLFPESKGIRVVVFIIIALLTIRSMCSKFAFKVAIQNVAIFKAVLKQISSDTHKKLLKKEGQESQRFISDLISGFNPILKYIFGKNIYKAPNIRNAFNMEDLLDCLELTCSEGRKKT